MAEANRDVELLREVLGELPAVLKNAPVMLALPSLLLAIGAVLDAWVASLHAVMPAVVGIAKGLGWALYFGLATRSSGGVSKPALATPLVTLALAFLALEYGGWGMLLGAFLWLLPLADYAAVYGEGPDGALGGVLDTFKGSAVIWLGSMAVLLLAIFMIGLVLTLPFSMFTDYAHRESAWVADLVGGSLVGPVVHIAVVYRTRLFLALHGDPA